MKQSLKIDPYGFREYDARWLYEKDINLLGITNLGKGLGTQITKQTNKTNPKVIVGHDYRSYSENIKAALKECSDGSDGYPRVLLWAGDSDITVGGIRKCAKKYQFAFATVPGSHEHINIYVAGIEEMRNCLLKCLDTPN